MHNDKNKMIYNSANLVLGLIVGGAAMFFFKDYLLPGDQSESVAGETVQAHEQQWTCSMHPDIIKTEPGKCPICFMDLIQLSEDTGGTTGERDIAFSPQALKLMEIRTTPVERKFVDAEIRLVGKIDYDETRVKHITAWTPGRIDRLYVDFTGTQVIKGDHMVYLYSPDLISAQAEYLQLLKSAEKFSGESSELIRNSTQATLKAARDKLLLLGLTEQQIDTLKNTAAPTDHITINAPMGGIVIEKHATEGMYVQTGAPIYTVADLSQLWIKLDAYEADMKWIRYGQQVEFNTEAYPGEVFTGQITFISPMVDPVTRTIKLRINVDNSNGKLKPDMFVRATVRSSVAQSGMVMDSDMAGKWICPMHPSVIKEKLVACDICGMDLVTTESLGYVQTDQPEEAPLVIPVTAALITGSRAVVYVQLPDTEKPTFQGREVVLGPRAGDYYLVEEGLTENEIVVTNGSFKIDSALQIKASPSMMNPQQHTMTAGHNILQKNCPVMGGKINPEVFIAYQGKNVYFCCSGCDEIFLKEPEKYLDKLPQFKSDQTMNHEDYEIEQKSCPVMGGKINPKVFITYQGKNVYFCCPGCDEIFLKEPEKYLDKLPQFKGN